MRWRLAVLPALLTSAVLLSGCLSIQGVSTSQQDIVGKVRLTFDVCASGTNDGAGPLDDHPGCPGGGNSGFYGVDGGQYQVLFAMRVPAGTGTPETITALPVPAPPASGPITLRRSASYAAAIEAGTPAAAGSHWVGYMSDPYAFDDGASGTPAQSAQVAVDLGLPATADGAPFVGPLPVQPVIGARQVQPELPADRPVQCGPTPATINGPDQTICVDGSTSPETLTIQTRDFGVVAGSATASAGQTVELPFNVRAVGALPAGLTAALSATTTLPGTSVTPSLPSAPLSNGSDTRVTVPVAIPADAAAGVYDVAVSGRLENGQTRTGVAKLTVRARPEPPVVTPSDVTDPRLSGLRIEPRSFRAATRKKPKRGTDVSFSLSEAASVRVAVERCARYAKPKGKRAKRKPPSARRCLRFATPRGGTARTGRAGANRFRFAGRVAGKPLKPGRYRLALTPTDAAGNRGRTARVGLTILR